MNSDRISNHQRAPLSAAFVAAMREVFGEVSVRYMSENGLELGEKSKDVCATAYYGFAGDAAEVE